MPQRTTRRSLIQAAVGAGVCLMLPRRATAAPSTAKIPHLLTQLLHAFAGETLPDGGVDVAKSPWQKPGRGAATGSTMFPGKIDPRYFRFEVEALYRFADERNEPRYRRAADAQVAYMAREITEAHQTW